MPASTGSPPGQNGMLGGGQPTGPQRATQRTASGGGQQNVGYRARFAQPSTGATAIGLVTDLAITDDDSAAAFDDAGGSVDILETFDGYSAADLPAPWLNPGLSFQGGSNVATTPDNTSTNIYAGRADNPATSYTVITKVKITGTTAAEAFLWAAGVDCVGVLDNHVAVEIRRYDSVTWALSCRDSYTTKGEQTLAGTDTDWLGTYVELKITMLPGVAECSFRKFGDTTWIPVTDYSSNPTFTTTNAGPYWGIGYWTANATYDQIELTAGSPAIAAATTDADSGAATDAGESVDTGGGVPISDAETSTAADAESGIALSDTGGATGTDAGEAITISHVEVGAGADAESSLVSAVADGEISVGTDSGSAISLSDADVSSGLDTNSTVAVDLADADTGAATDGLEALALADADVASGADGGESVTVAGTTDISDADSGAATDTETFSVLTSDADTASSTEGGVLGLGDSDSASTGDTEAVTIEVSDFDITSAIEIEVLDAVIGDVDTMSAADVSAAFSFIIGPQTRHLVPGLKPAHNSQQRTANRLMRHFANGLQEEDNLWLLTDNSVTTTQPWDASTIAKAWYGGHVNTVTTDEAVLLLAAGYTVDRVETF